MFQQKTFHSDIAPSAWNSWDYNEEMILFFTTNYSEGQNGFRFVSKK